MKILLIFTLFLISVGGGESERVTGYSGGGVLIKCTYDTGYTSNPKYLCTGLWPCMTKPIWTDAKNEWINSGRFSLFDDTRAAEFWVLIRELTVEDSGTYKCRVDKFGIDVYTPVELKVEEDLSYEKSINLIGHVGGSVDISCKYPQSHSSDPKFLCRRVDTADCNNKTSFKESRRWINEGKLYLHDDGKQIFTVSFNNMTEGDSGEYWCGAESDWTSDHGYKVYITQINLRVTGG
ncbi:polymeric immunoglobulin receptor-like [Colossoma macropomum]|uniref:polymeric immunoglobulin receptor-like n=1 Tax=Colossoma macropomum TaxID=42526 RepID=UPI00186411C0|nr:polymeric immunoglobulin receptor-like [Colossoma macropomum]